MKQDCFGFNGISHNCSVLSGDTNCMTCHFYATRRQVEAARANADAKLEAKGLRRTIVVRDDVQIMTVVPIDKEVEVAI